MLYPNPLSLFCAILLCFPLALVVTITSNYTFITSRVTNCKLTLATFSIPPPPPPPPPPPSSPSPPPPAPPPPPLKLITKHSKNKASSKNTSTPIATTNVTNLTQPLIKQKPLSPPRPPPQPPEDDKDDVDLLKRASQVNPNPIQGHQKKAAFLFLTTTPLPFAPLWESFFNQSVNNKGKYNIYIHADPKKRYKPPFTGVFSGRVVPSSKPTRRNTPTLITAARRLLAQALLDDPDNHMFTILSPACIPLHSFNFTYNTLTNSTKSFIEVLSNETTAYARWAARGDHAMLPEVKFEDFRIGSQFWTLTRQHAHMVVKDIKLWRKFRLPCVKVNTCYPEENYFPTLLHMMDPQNIVPATLNNVNWFGRYDGHPHTYNATQVDPQLIRWLRDARPRYGDMSINGSDLSLMKRWDPFLFARKFEPNCLEPLLSLAKDVLFKD